MSNKKSGRVKSWDTNKGYGFVVSDGVDHFAHHSFIQFGQEGQRNLEVGQLVEFIPDQDEKGLKAKEITLPQSIEQQNALKWWGIL